jgi:AcrR family transcriptional regulator
MTDNVKRPYRSVVREQQAIRTRAAIIEAARAEFVARGYAATSIDDIAAAAQVARRTVYAVGGKPELLKLAYETALAGDHEQVEDRPEVAQMVAEPDPVVDLHLYVDMSLGIGARVGPIHAALRAASGDERVRALYEHFQERRAAAARRVVRFLVGRGAPISRPDTAADVLWLLIDPGTYHALVDERGWTEQQMADWLHAAVAQQVLDHEPVK